MCMHKGTKFISVYSETSDNGPSEIRTSSIQQTNHMPPIDVAIELIHFQPLRYYSGQQTNSILPNNCKPYKITSESGQRSKPSGEMVLKVCQFVTQQHLESPLIFRVVHCAPYWINSAWFNLPCGILGIEGSSLLVNLLDSDNLPTKDRISAPNVSVIQRFHCTLLVPVLDWVVNDCYYVNLSKGRKTLGKNPVLLFASSKFQLDSLSSSKHTFNNLPHPDASQWGTRHAQSV